MDKNLPPIWPLNNLNEPPTWASNSGAAARVKACTISTIFHSKKKINLALRLLAVASPSAELTSVIRQFPFTGDLSSASKFISKPTNSSLNLFFDQSEAFFSVQCQLFTLVASGRSSTIQRGSPSPHLAIVLI
uniref:Uncharacterized protein n=1 Tax=Romanomermis culicivorax TaxID=13658 RepID=A0A915KSC1_ROMCU